MRRIIYSLADENVTTLLWKFYTNTNMVVNKLAYYYHRIKTGKDARGHKSQNDEFMRWYPVFVKEWKSLYKKIFVSENFVYLTNDIYEYKRAKSLLLDISNAVKLITHVDTVDGEYECRPSTVKILGPRIKESMQYINALKTLMNVQYGKESWNTLDSMPMIERTHRGIRYDVEMVCPKDGEIEFVYKLIGTIYVNNTVINSEILKLRDRANVEHFYNILKKRHGSEFGHWFYQIFEIKTDNDEFNKDHIEKYNLVKRNCTRGLVTMHICGSSVSSQSEFAIDIYIDGKPNDLYIWYKRLKFSTLTLAIVEMMYLTEKMDDDSFDLFIHKLMKGDYDEKQEAI